MKFDPHTHLKKLEEIEVRLARIALTSPGEPLVSERLRRAFDDAHGFLFKYANKLRPPIPIVYHLIISHTHTVIEFFSRLANLLSSICDDVKKLGITMHPDPCLEHTLDSRVDLIKGDLRLFVEHVGSRVLLRVREAEFCISEFPEFLKVISLDCVFYVGSNCLRYADPDKVTPASLRAYVLDLASAVGLVGNVFAERYPGVKEWKIGSVLLYEHPRTKRELLGMAEYVANVLHKQVEAKMLFPNREGEIAVFSLKDMIEVVVDTGFAYEAFIKPMWVIDVRTFRDKEDLMVLKRLVEELGFKMEIAAYGFRVIAVHGDVREAAKLALMIPELEPVKVVGEERSYEILTSALASLESKLKRQKPLPKRRAGL